MENILFKQSFRGFDRNQVLEYIDGLSNEMSRQAEYYNKIQKGLEEEIRTLSDKLSLTGENLNVSQEKVVQLIRADQILCFLCNFALLVRGEQFGAYRCIENIQQNRG